MDKNKIVSQLEFSVDVDIDVKEKIENIVNNIDIINKLLSKDLKRKNYNDRRER